MNDSGINREDLSDIVGEGRTLEAAYADFAHKVSDYFARTRGLTGEEGQAFFDANPIHTKVEIVVQAHNEWVKAYWVKAY